MGLLLVPLENVHSLSSLESMVLRQPDEGIRLNIWC